MKKLIGGIACLLAGPVQAQLHGNTVYPAIQGTGFTILGDFGRGLNDDAWKSNYFGGRAELGLPMVSFWAGAGRVKTDDELDPGGEGEIVFGGGAALNIVQGPMVPVTVSIAAGVGFLSEEGYGSSLFVPAGVVLAINVPSPTVDVKPWIMPRIELESFSPDVGESSSEVGFGVSGGLNVTLPNGFGFHASGDWRKIEDFKPIYLNAGVHYTVAIPSLGPPII
jgi:hypothetical protein